MACSEGEEHIFNRVMPLDNIGLIAVLTTSGEVGQENGLYLLLTRLNYNIQSSKRQQNLTLKFANFFSFTGRPVVVGNTHLHWDPQFPDVKLIQSAIFANE